MMRAAAYVRLSEVTDTTTSPERQRADIAKTIEAHGWDHNPDVDLYEDIDVSAYSGITRPAYNRLMGSLDEYDVLVCWKLDRLLRSVRRDLGPLLEALDANGVRLHSVQEGLDNSSPGGEFVITVMAALAQSESATSGLRIRSAQQHLAQTGRWRGGKVPYGWKVAPHPQGGKRLVLDDAEAAVLLQIVGWLEQGVSGREVANRLNAASVPTRQDKIWSQRQVYNMARSPRMVGWQVAGGNEIVRDPDGNPVVGPEPLLDVPRWQRLVALLEGVEWDRTRRTGATLLSGLVRCGRCGGPMGGWTADHPQATYHCSRKANNGAAYCRGLAMKRVWVDEYVEAAVLEHARRHRARIPTARREEPADRLGEREANLVAQLRRLERDRTELGLYDDPESEQTYAARWRDLRRQIQIVREQRRMRDARDARPSFDSVAPADLDGAWVDMSVDEKRAVIRSLVETVTIMPPRPESKRGRWDRERVRIVWIDGA